jgi:glycerol uptake facilitator protein
MTPFIAEIIGTMIIILFGNGVVANVVLNNTKGNNSGWIVITAGWAFGVFAGVTVAGPVSGAHLNPAVTIALAISGKFAWNLAGSYILAQMLGAMLGASLVWLFYKNHFDITNDEGGKLACFCTGPAIRNKFSNFTSETIATFVFILVVLYIAGPQLHLNSDNNATIGLGAIGALPVAFLVWAVGLSLGGTTGYAINPARDLGPRIVHSILPFEGTSDWDYAWIPVLGPILGASLAAGLYIILQ